MTRWKRLQRIAWNPRGLTVLTGSALIFLLLAYYFNGQPSIITAQQTTAASFFYPHYGLVLLLSILFGTTMTIFQYNYTRNTAAGQGTTGALSVVSVLVSGCAGCAAGLLPSILAFLGVGSTVLSLPFLGLEILVAAVLLYLGIIYYLLSPSQCSIPD